MIDHTGLLVSNFAASRAFYNAALAPLGIEVILSFPSGDGGEDDVAGYGEPPKPDFWVAAGAPNQPPLHIAFRARDRASVEAFYRAALAAGGTDNGPPGIRPHYHANYYAAFVLDPDGHNIEAVCHTS